MGGYLTKISNAARSQGYTTASSAINKTQTPQTEKSLDNYKLVDEKSLLVSGSLLKKVPDPEDCKNHKMEFGMGIGITIFGGFTAVRFSTAEISKTNKDGTPKKESKVSDEEYTRDLIVGESAFLDAGGLSLIAFGAIGIKKYCGPPPGPNGTKEKVPVTEEIKENVVKFKTHYQPQFKLVRIEEPKTDPGPSAWEVLGVTLLVGAGLLLVPKPIPAL